MSLGPYTDVARDVLFGVKPLSAFKEFQVMVQRYTSKHFDTEGFYSLPVPAPFGEFESYGFGIAGFRLMAKVDSRPFPTEWGCFIPFSPYLLLLSRSSCTANDASLYELKEGKAALEPMPSEPDGFPAVGHK